MKRTRKEAWPNRQAVPDAAGNVIKTKGFAQSTLVDIEEIISECQGVMFKY